MSGPETALLGHPAAARAGRRLRVLTLNTHKGLSSWNRRHMLSELRDAARSTAADLVFLQEVMGQGGRLPEGATTSAQYEFLADSLWPQFAYGRNAATAGTDHGNALLSRLPIREWHNHAAPGRGEKRGLLHCVLDAPGASVHAVCVHFGLREAQRRQQLQALCRLVQTAVPGDVPLIVAGDFNDWRERADAGLSRCGLRSAFALLGQGTPRTFPARFPLLRLDRIYVRNAEVRSAAVLSAMPWPHLSDHLPLLAEVAA